MTCEHCEKDDMTIIDTTRAAQPIVLNLKTQITSDAACVAPTFCACECHNVNADRGA